RGGSQPRFLGIRLRCAFPNLVVEAFSATTILHVSQRLAGERSSTPEVRGRSASYTPEEVDVVLATHFHSDHVGGLITQDGKRVFPNAEVYVAKAESDFWLSPEIAAKAPKEAQPFFQSAQAIAAPYIKASKWHTFSGSESIVDGMQIVPLPGHTPGHTGYEFSSKGQKILFWGDIVHAQRVQLQHPEVTAMFDIDQTAAAATRNQLLAKLAREDVLIAAPH